METNRFEGLTWDWFSNIENNWTAALARYWDFVRPENMELETAMEQLDLNEIANFNAEEWYHFLHNKYFKWKYTAPNRYKTTTSNLKKYIMQNQLDELNNIKNRLLSLDIKDIRNGFLKENKIKGLGIPGVSGLLSLMYPTVFATVDQFVVKALKNIPNLPEHDEICKINENSIKLNEGVLLIHIMQKKAEELNHKFLTNFWTPRKIDMLLWAVRNSSCNTCRKRKEG